jgi:hypothetical protein
MGWLAVGLLCWGAGAQAELRYRIEALGLPEGADTSQYLQVLPSAINNRGEVVGAFNGPTTEQTGFVYRKGRVELLGADAQHTTVSAFDINDRGQIVGQMHADGGRLAPYLYDKGRFKDLGVALSPTRFGEATSINNAGQVVGQIFGQAFMYDGKGSRYLDIAGARSAAPQSINEAGVVAGRAFVNGDDGLGQRAFILDNQGTRLLLPPAPEPFSVFGMDINNAGQLAVFSIGNGPQYSFVYGDGRYTPVPSLTPEPTARIFALNDKGYAVGDSVAFKPEGGTNTAALLFHDGRSYNLNDLMRPQDDADWYLYSASDINERGQITGYGIFKGILGMRGFIATPVPEIETWAMLLLGGGVVAAWVRRRKSFNPTATSTPGPRPWCPPSAAAA